MAKAKNQSDKKMKTSEILLTIMTGGLAFCIIGFGALFIWLMISL